MTATATNRGKTVDWQLWLPGIAAPIACFVFDFAAGEHLLLVAPAGLLCLAAIGIASLAISRNRRGALAGLVTVGPMWIVGGLTLALAIPLTAIGGVGLLLSFAMLVRHALLGLFVLIGALLGFSTFWTGVTYLVEAHALTKEQAAAHGRLKTVLFARLRGLHAGRGAPPHRALRVALQPQARQLAQSRRVRVGRPLQPMSRPAHRQLH